MGVFDVVREDMKQAMKAKQTERLATLKFVISALKNKEIQKRPDPLTEADVIQTLKKLVKQNRETLDQYKQAGTDAKKEALEKEISTIEGYLPQSFSADETQKMVDEVVSDIGASAMSDMGRVMKELQKRGQNRLDGALTSSLVKKKLG